MTMKERSSTTRLTARYVIMNTKSTTTIMTTIAVTADRSWIGRKTTMRLIDADKLIEKNIEDM